MKTIAEQVQIGDPLADETEVGPLCTTAQVEHCQREVNFAIEQGATLITGGKSPKGMRGQFFEPTILDCPSQDLRVVDTELFGPVVAAMRFKTEAEALALANDTKHGLAAGIFTRDGARAMRMSNAIKAGIVWVNTYRAISPIAEFGGMKHSGYGRESGFQAVYDYTRPKTVWINTSSEPLGSQFVAR
jgi:acyl-CoA reductase-like NAD-dependent aldehyde dehydrogenase